MKPYQLIILLAAILLFNNPAGSQVLKKIKKTVTESAEIIESAEGVLSKTKKQDNASSDESKNEVFNDTQEVESSQEATRTQSQGMWTNYDFVPGEEIIFEDNLSGEQNGEFPSQWDLVKGHAENATISGYPVIVFEGGSIIMPLMNSTDYLPDVFTLEFDAYFDELQRKPQVYHQRYRLRFWEGHGHGKNNTGVHDFYNPLDIYRNGSIITGKLHNQKKQFSGIKDEMTGFTGWRHVAIAFNKRSLKVYIDQFRALNIPNLGYVPKMISFEGYSHNNDQTIRAIKNIRIAHGGKKLYDRVQTDEKIISYGILFDYNKASLQPASAGTINEMVSIMKQQPSLKFRIEGHTDSDGDETFNLELSQQRAEEVKKAMVLAGIDPGRLEVKGRGESMPLENNETSLGKSKNRRVEFIKI